MKQLSFYADLWWILTLFKPHGHWQFGSFLSNLVRHCLNITQPDLFISIFFIFASLVGIEYAALCRVAARKLTAAALSHQQIRNQNAYSIKSLRPAAAHFCVRARSSFENPIHQTFYDDHTTHFIWITHAMRFGLVGFFNEFESAALGVVLDKCAARFSHNPFRVYVHETQTICRLKWVCTHRTRTRACRQLGSSKFSLNCPQSTLWTMHYFYSRLCTVEENHGLIRPEANKIPISPFHMPLKQCKFRACKWRFSRN